MHATRTAFAPCLRLLCAAGLGTLLVAATPHGGAPMPPVVIHVSGGKPPVLTGSGGPTAPTSGKSPGNRPSTPATGAGKAAGRGSTAAAAGTPAAGSGRPVSGSGTTGSLAVRSSAAWEAWWLRNQDRLLDLRARLADEVQASGSAHPLTGLGRAERGGSRRAAAAQVSRDIVPVLFELLSDPEPEVLDSTLIALGRCADEADAGRLDEAVRPLLAHPALSVQTSAVLALGVHGSARAVPLLGALMADTTAGRRAVGGGAVPAPLRALAALSLGLGNHPAAVPLLADLARHLPDAERDLKACALTALGLAANEASDEALRELVSLLQDRRLDAALKAHAAVALARLDGGSRSEALPVLQSTFAHRDTDDLVRAACAAALGRLARGHDGASLDALLAEAAGGRHEATRQAARMALAEVGLRDLQAGGLAPGLHERLGRLLVAGMRGETAHADRPWAALAAGLYAAGGGPLAGELRRQLLVLLDEQRDVEVRSAVLLALGLAGEPAAIPALREDFARPADPALRGYAAVALGLLGDRDSADGLRAACADPACEPALREQLAVGLGLLGDPQVVPALLAVLEAAEVHEASIAAARALGRLGDRAAIPALVRLARDASGRPVTRGMAVVALGLLGERGALPWNAPLKELDPGVARVPSLDLVLDIL